MPDNLAQNTCLGGELRNRERICVRLLFESNVLCLEILIYTAMISIILWDMKFPLGTKPGLLVPAYAMLAVVALGRIS